MRVVDSWNASCANLAAWFHKKDQHSATPASDPAATNATPAEPVVAAIGAQGLIDEMLSLGRYALLLRPQLIGNLASEQFDRAHDALADGMCLIPQGEVLVQRHLDVPAKADQAGRNVDGLEVEPYYLDRFSVTNDLFHKFVAAGGYEQMALWDPEIWPAVLDFVDRTGHPGPRFWRHGHFARGEDRHPVVGISWYEAAAFSRWVGKRLPTDAEWVKAAAWPVAIPGHPLLQRRYPWGEAIDRERANLWGSGIGHAVSVSEFPGGVSVGGPQQLIGNVWEWTADPLQLQSGPPSPNDPPQPKMFSLRGGAYDTYLDCQCTSQFQSGDKALARKHNIGFRCALGVCDVVDRDVASPAIPADETNDSLEEAHV